MIDVDHFECTTSHYLQRLIAQILGKLVAIVVVSIAPTMVVKP